MSEYRLEMRNIVKTFPGVKALDKVKEPKEHRRGRELER